MTNPKDKATPSLNTETPQDRVVEAERLYDAPDREEVEDADEGLAAERLRRKRPESADPVIDVNVGKPI